MSAEENERLRKMFGDEFLNSLFPDVTSKAEPQPVYDHESGLSSWQVVKAPDSMGEITIRNNYGGFVYVKIPAFEQLAWAANIPDALSPKTGAFFPDFEQFLFQSLPEMLGKEGLPDDYKNQSLVDISFGDGSRGEYDFSVKGDYSKRGDYHRFKSEFIYRTIFNDIRALEYNGSSSEDAIDFTLHVDYEQGSISFIHPTTEDGQTPWNNQFLTWALSTHVSGRLFTPTDATSLTTILNNLSKDNTR